MATRDQAWNIDHPDNLQELATPTEQRQSSLGLAAQPFSDWRVNPHGAELRFPSCFQ